MSTQLNRHLSLSLLFILIFSVVTCATEGDLLWSHSFGGTGWDEAFSVIQTNDGGYLAAGSTSSFGAGSCDMWLVKTNAAGDSLWTRTYGTPGWEGAYCAIQCSDGGYLLVGDASSLNHSWLLKVNARGDSLWCCSFGGPGFDYLYSVIETSDGGYVAAGSTEGDMWLVKANAAGDSLWSHHYGSPEGSECALDVIETTEGGYLLAGMTNSSSGDDMLLTKANARGDSLWSRTYGGNMDDQARSVLQTPDGGYLAAGHTMSFGNGYFDMWLIRLDAHGDSLWSQTYDILANGGDAYAFSLISTSDDNYLLAGEVRHPGGPPSFDLFLVKVNSAGDTLWTRTYESGIEKDECANAVIQTTNGSYIIAGYSKPWGISSKEMLLACLEGPASGGEDFREEISASAVSSSKLTPQNISLQSISPNPCNPSAVASFELRVPSYVSLRVYDSAGRQVAILVDGWREAGDHEVTFDGSALPSGIYVYHFQAGGQVANGKLILLK